MISFKYIVKILKEDILNLLHILTEKIYPPQKKVNRPPPFPLKNQIKAKRTYSAMESYF